MRSCECGQCSLNIEAHPNDTMENTTYCTACIQLKESEPSMSITPMVKKDLELVLAWRSNPEIYEHFREQDGPLAWENHSTWFHERADDRYDFIIHYNGRRVGSISLNTEDEVGIFIGDSSAQGRGVAKSALQWLCSRFEERTPLFAEVNKENTPSIQLFSRCGFEKVTEDGDWVQFQYSP